ncbi:GNAT family N-acetyltransferase [Aciditerrimonas ferrireducens]|uniref:GNAT family N-acetyltransferase n=1 Tax=Aciditerrimonas ferrireducens TaxID=667306 RepID=UPI0020052FEA|nr:GNAT family protein [Aciditerrimonas ferrireducens]MCK4176482.1 GNAT family N-acetyltransferase [Aciditerrimonas ferrireducens]
MGHEASEGTSNPPDRPEGAEEVLWVRPMTLEEAPLRIDYFLGASDDYLRLLGVDRAKLPTREAWLARYEDDLAKAPQERDTYSIVWLLGERIVGFSTADRIQPGQEAFLHLHVLDPGRRRQGLGSRFVRLSAEHYREVLGVPRLYSQPNALNVAPNRALQRAGFRYLWTKECVPGPINFRQAVTRWVWEAR